MTDLEQSVWEAIEQALTACGDEDIRAGLAWLKEGGQQRIAQAAIEAVRTHGQSALSPERNRS